MTTALDEVAILQGYEDAIDGKGHNALYGRERGEDDPERCQRAYDLGYAEGTETG